MEIELQNPNPIIHIHKEALNEKELEERKIREFDEDAVDPVDSLESTKELKIILMNKKFSIL